jgi:hypothetical protein
MAKKDNTLEEIGEFFVMVGNAIWTGIKWTWDNISIVVCIFLFANIFVVALLNVVWAVISGIILVIFALRTWMDFRDDRGY